MKQFYIGVDKDMIKKTLMAAFSAMVLTAAAGAQAVEFDGRGAPAAGGGLAETVKASAPEVKVSEIGTGVKARGWQQSKICKVVELDSNDGAAINRQVSLDAAYTWQECENASAMVNGQYISASNCHDRAEWYTAYVNLVIHARQLRQFDKERIEVCYDFKAQKGSFALRQTPFDYTYRDKQGESRYTVELYPGARKPQNPDAALAQLGKFSYDDVRKEFTLTIRNGFTGEYDGRKVHIGVELVQDKMFDSSRGTKFFEFPLNWLRQDFKIVFKESDFPSDKDAADFRAKAKKYFVNWGFKVKGEGFTEAYMEKGKTETVAVIQ
jgi:hypothetical protein